MKILVPLTYLWDISSQPLWFVFKDPFLYPHMDSPPAFEDLSDVLEDLLDGLKQTKDLSLQELSLKGFPISSKVKERPLDVVIIWTSGRYNAAAYIK